MKILRNVLGLLLVTGGVASADIAPMPADAAKPTDSPKPAAVDVSALMTKVDELQATRDSAGSAKQIDELLSQASKAAPNDYGVLWRAARQHCWIGEGLPATQGTRRTAEAKQCWDLGAKAAAIDSSKVEGNYYASYGAGNYSTEIGIMKALSHGMEGIFNGFLDKALEQNPKLDNGAPLVAKARYFQTLPWPKRNRDKAVELYKKCLAVQPKNVRAKLWLAETLDQDGKAKEAKVFLDQAIAQVAAGGNDYDPPELRRVAGWVDPIKTKIEEDLK